ncbi:MAG TPA: PKD domain-containing protein, partial [Rhodanobacteraceae bacterium]|nr:PKD domain-containing protein [Rhodanobacteraceae bacterium]
EEINRIPALPLSGASLQNFGWPCFEGRGQHAGFNVPICTRLYNDSGERTPATPPWYTYNHNNGPDTGSGSDITGLAFYEGSLYPAMYQNSLFFADNSRTVIFNIPYADTDGDGIPDPPPDDGALPFFDGSSATAVQLISGPGGDIFLSNLLSGRISRLSYCNLCTNRAPAAAIALDAGSIADGPPRTIAFSAANSVDPDTGDTLVYDWDLDGDGVFGDASGVTASRFYDTDGSYRVAVRVTDTSGASDVQSMLVTVVGNLGAADVGVTLDDGVSEVFPGDTLSYALVVTNHGTDTVPGETVASVLSPSLGSVAWTCAASTGASCQSSGLGDVADSVDLPAGGSVTYTITAQVPANAAGQIESAANVTPAPGYEDPNTNDNAASDIDTVVGDRIFADGFDPP